MKPQIIHPDKDPQDFTFKGKHPTLEELQAAVGGYIEVVKLDRRTIMLVDEDGLPKSLPLNEVASMMALRPIVGTAVVMPARLLK